MQGNAYSAKGDFDKAIEYLNKAHEIMSHFAEHQFKQQVELNLKANVIAKEYSIDPHCALNLLAVCLGSNLDFFDYKAQLVVSDAFYNKNDLKLSLAVNQSALNFAENNESTTDREKKSILHNTGCLYNIMSQKAQNDNDQEKSQEYALKAEESFQKALSYSNDLEDSAGLYAEYANFLIGQSKFKEAFEYLQKSVASNDKTSGLQYGEIEKEVIADILKQSITNSSQKEIKLNPKEYAYYLLIANYAKFKSADISNIEEKTEYLEQFQSIINQEEQLKYISCLLLANAYQECDKQMESSCFAWASLFVYANENPSSTLTELLTELTGQDKCSDEQDELHV